MKTLAVAILTLAALSVAEAQQQQPQQAAPAVAARPAAPEPVLKVLAVQRVRLKGDDRGPTDRAGISSGTYVGFKFAEKK